MFKSKACFSIISLSYPHLNSARARFVRVSARLGLVWPKSRLGLALFFSSENGSLGSASKARHHLHHKAYIPPYIMTVIDVHASMWEGLASRGVWLPKTIL